MRNEKQLMINMQKKTIVTVLSDTPEYLTNGN